MPPLPFRIALARRVQTKVNAAQELGLALLLNASSRVLRRRAERFAIATAASVAAAGCGGPVPDGPDTGAAIDGSCFDCGVHTDAKAHKDASAETGSDAGQHDGPAVEAAQDAGGDDGDNDSPSVEAATEAGHD